VAAIGEEVLEDFVGLICASGDMKAAGLKEVERAKNDGRWKDAYDSPKPNGPASCEAGP
jgi:uncharacterized protein YdeI (YjbR/CyaY-like superfamily)